MLTRLRKLKNISEIVKLLNFPGIFYVYLTVHTYITSSMFQNSFVLPHINYKLIFPRTWVFYFNNQFDIMFLNPFSFFFNTSEDMDFYEAQKKQFDIIFPIILI